MVAGAFDLLHPGHLHLFQQAKELGELVVVVARDSSVSKLKGRKPFFSQEERVKMVSAIRYVDEVVLGGSNPFDTVARLKPDVLLLGYDQQVDVNALKAFLKANGFKTRVARARAFQPHKFKSSRLRKILGVR